MTQIFFDIETLHSGPKPTDDEMRSLVPKNYKKEEAIAAWCAANSDTIYRKRALSSHEAQICCISYSLDGEKINSIYGDDEKKLMTEFNDSFKELSTMDLYSMEWIGHNIISFDLPMIWLRACKYGLNPLKDHIPHGRADASRIIDTMKLFGGTDYRSMVSLKDCCKFFNIPVKIDIHGSEVFDVWQEDPARVVEYCAEDTKAVIELYDKLI